MKSPMDLKKIIKGTLLLSVVFGAFLANTNIANAGETIPGATTATSVAWIYGNPAYYICWKVGDPIYDIWQRTQGYQTTSGCSPYPVPVDGYGSYTASLDSPTYYVGAPINLSVTALTLKLGGSAGNPGVGVTAYDQNNNVIVSCSASNNCAANTTSVYTGPTFHAPTTPGTYTIHFTGCWRTGGECSNYSPLTYTVTLPPPPPYCGDTSTTGSFDSNCVCSTARPNKTPSYGFGCGPGSLAQYSGLCFTTYYCEPNTIVSVAPTVTTAPITNITQTTATSGGTIVSNGGGTVTESGILWGTSDPYIVPSTSKTTDGWAIGGPWSSTMTGLTPGTTYHVRAYATSMISTGYITGYGNEVTFTTASPTPTVNIKFSFVDKVKQAFARLFS